MIEASNLSDDRTSHRTLEELKYVKRDDLEKEIAASHRTLEELKWK